MSQAALFMAFLVLCAIPHTSSAPAAARPPSLPASPVVEALVAHVAAEDAAVGGEPRDGNPHVVVNLEYLPPASQGGKLLRVVGAKMLLLSALFLFFPLLSNVLTTLEHLRLRYANSPVDMPAAAMAASRGSSKGLDSAAQHRTLRW